VIVVAIPVYAKISHLENLGFPDIQSAGEGVVEKTCRAVIGCTGVVFGGLL
jgi:hypothetical protein